MSQFVVGNPVRDEYFYDRSSELRAVLAQRWTWICGQRRMGKTSLLFRVRTASVERGCVPLYLNLAHMRKADARGDLLFDKLFTMNRRKIVKPFNLRPAEFNDTDPVERFGQLVGRIHEAGKEVILLFDEAERLLHLEENDCGFLESLRGRLHDLDGVHFVLSGTQGLTGLFGQEGRCSQFLSAFRCRPLGAFDPEVARSLLQAEQTGGWSRPLDDRLVERAAEWCGGHPLMLQEVGALLEERLDRESASDRLLKSCFRELAANPGLREIFANDFTHLIPAQQAVLTAACHHQDGIAKASLAEATGHESNEIEIAARTLAQFGYVHRGDPVRLRFLFYRQMLPSTPSTVDAKKLMRLVARRVFISYARKDAEWLGKLKRFLDPVVGDGVEIWDDGRIQPGEDWRKEIEQALEEAEIALLLVSSDFLASKFISEVELPVLLAGNRRVLCLHVRPSALADEIPQSAREPLRRLSEFQALNDPQAALSTLPEPEQERLLAAITTRLSQSLSQSG